MHLGMTAAGVRASIRRGELEAVKFGRSWRIPRSALESLQTRAHQESEQRQLSQAKQAREADDQRSWSAAELRAL
ncbi:MAG: hypothetical protein DHS20C21_01800 [Gemmatimonadota bacterium]|nr:MAG: hypothetical protein DHS20C21_01800 [Gemmatimonadota bacterium]